MDCEEMAKVESTIRRLTRGRLWGHGAGLVGQRGERTYWASQGREAMLEASASEIREAILKEVRNPGDLGRPPQVPSPIATSWYRGDYLEEVFKTALSLSRAYRVGEIAVSMTGTNGVLIVEIPETARLYLAPFIEV